MRAMACGWHALLMLVLVAPPVTALDGGDEREASPGCEWADVVACAPASAAVVFGGGLPVRLRGAAWGGRSVTLVALGPRECAARAALDPRGAVTTLRVGAVVFAAVIYAPLDGEPHAGSFCASDAARGEWLVVLLARRGLCLVRPEGDAGGCAGTAAAAAVVEAAAPLAAAASGAPCAGGAEEEEEAAWVLTPRGGVAVRLQRAAGAGGGWWGETCEERVVACAGARALGMLLLAASVHVALGGVGRAELALGVAAGLAARGEAWQVARAAWGGVAVALCGPDARAAHDLLVCALLAWQAVAGRCGGGLGHMVTVVTSVALAVRLCRRRREALVGGGHLGARVADVVESLVVPAVVADGALGTSLQVLLPGIPVTRELAWALAFVVAPVVATELG